MAYTLYPNVSVEKANAILEEFGVFGAVEKKVGQLKLYKRESRRVDPKTGEPTRVRHQILEDGSRIRIAADSGDTIEKPKE